ILIHQSLRGILINQAKYALEILKKHGMERCESLGTPLATKPNLDADLSGTPIDQTKYHSMIGSLMYLTSSRPDLVRAVCYCARYQARPTEKHLKEIKMIFRCLKGTINMELWYPKDYGFELTAFSDADHAGCLDTRKSTYGGIQFLGDKLVSWVSKKQDCTTMSSAEAEYVALSASSSTAGNPIKEILLRLNLPDHRRRCYILILAESDSLPYAHAQATKTTISIKIQESRKLKFKYKDFRNSDIQDLPKDIKVIKTKIVKGDC
ncbi:hypothetical protein Tco_0811423, partial [Tanacetum coccineum]